MDKEEYFHQLDALNESSDSEQDTNDAREVIGQSAQPSSSSSYFPVPSQPAAARRNQLLGKSKKVPIIHRTMSEPVTSTFIIRETYLPTKKSSKTKPRYDRSSPPELAQSFSNMTPPTASNSTPAIERSTSIPDLGFQRILAMPNSTGVDMMLKRKTTRVDPVLSKAITSKRKREKPIEMMPEGKQVFAGKTFFLIPNDDVGKIRKNRIPQFRRHGAVWVKEWTSTITHILVDKDYDFDAVMKLLKPMMRTDTIPSNIILVKENYAVDCIKHLVLLDEKQSQYQVKSRPSLVQEEAQGVKPQASSKSSTRNSKKYQETPQEVNQRSESESQPTRLDLNDLYFGAQPPTDRSGHAVQAEISREKSPILDMDITYDSELGQMIKLVQKFGDLPLEDDDEGGGDRRGSSDDDSNPDHEGSLEEDLRPRKSRKNKYGKKKFLDEHRYICMLGGTGEILENNPNSKTIEILERMKEYYERVQDHWRTLAYRRAIGLLKKIPVKIATFDQAIEIPHIGERLAAKIEEIVLTGRLKRLENADLEPEDLILQQFLKIYGVGLVEASKFIKQGYKTLDDLRTKSRLTKNQRIGLDHYDDFNTRIPRDEVTTLGAIVKDAIRPIDPDVEAIVGGSYRRGAATSGDIDFILTKPGTSSTEDLLPFLYSLVDQLTRDGFLTAALATPSHSREDSGSKWHGACKLPDNPIWRRIDFLLVPETQLGAGLIYFTGDDLFNRSIRLLARHKGCGLNQRGLYKNVLRDPNGKKISDGEPVEGRDEREIFDYLGVPWRKPEHRICH